MVPPSSSQAGVSGDSVRAVGGSAPVFPRTITQADLDGFAQLSGDHNPIHVDPAYASRTPFRLPVAHGMFLYSLAAAQLQRRWPDRRVVEFSLMFPTATPVGSRVTGVLDDVADAPVPGEAGTRGRVVAGFRVLKEDGTDGLRGQFTLAGPTSAAEDLGTGYPGPEDVNDIPDSEVVDTLPVTGRRHVEKMRFTLVELEGYERLSSEDCRGAVPAGLIAGWFSKILGMDLPGQGTNYLKQRLSLDADARVGEELTATASIERVVPEKGLVYLGVLCTGQDGRRIAHGTALVLSPGSLPAKPEETR